MPKVSIIVPNYNHEAFLEERLKSIFNQSFQDFEVILLDDYSTDDSTSILNKYFNHSKVTHYIQNTKNSGGPFQQWKKGLELAKGEYVWMAESDDYCDVNFLASCMHHFNADPEISLVFTNTILRNVSTKTETLLVEEKESGKYHAFNDNFFYNWFYKNNKFRLVNASACVFKRDLLDHTILKNLTSYQYGGDKYFWLSILLKSPSFYFIHEAHNVQHAHGQTTRASKSFQSMKKRNEELLTIYKIYQEIDNRKDKPVRLEMAMRYLQKNIANFKTGFIINIAEISKSILWVGFNLSFFKKLISTLRSHN